MVADLFHINHVKFLKNCSNLCNNLFVGIVSDKVAEKHKGKPIMTTEERVGVVESCKYVDKVIRNAPWAPDKDFLEKYNINSTSLGYVKYVVRAKTRPIKNGIKNTITNKVVNDSKRPHTKCPSPCVSSPDSSSISTILPPLSLLILLFLLQTGQLKRLYGSYALLHEG